MKHINDTYDLKYQFQSVTKIQSEFIHLNQSQLNRLQQFLAVTQRLEGSMDNTNILSILARAFNSSTLTQSEELFRQIEELAGKKLLTSNKNIDDSREKIQIKSCISRPTSKAENMKTKRKFITRQRLKQSAMRKISRDNKMLHENHFRSMQQRFDNMIHQEQKRCRIQSISDKEEYKLELPQVTQQARIQDMKNKNRNSLNRLIAPQRIATYTCPKAHVQKKFKKTRKNFQTYLKSSSIQFKIDELTCPICIETLIDPVSTICGHSFCLHCLDQSLLFASTCPVCRFHIKGMELVPCQYLEQLIKVKHEQSLEDTEALKVYRKRKEDNEKWKKARFINFQQVKKGLTIDARDTESIWCQAEVLKVYTVKHRISSVLVHYLHWARLYDEIIEIKSSRLAPKGHFSSRTDLPRYNLNQAQQNLRGAVITGVHNNNAQMMRGQNQVVQDRARQFYGIPNMLDFNRSLFPNHHRPLERENFIDQFVINRNLNRNRIINLNGVNLNYLSNVIQLEDIDDSDSSLSIVENPINQMENQIPSDQAQSQGIFEFLHRENQMLNSEEHFQLFSSQPNLEVLFGYNSDNPIQQGYLQSQPQPQQQQPEQQEGQIQNCLLHSEPVYNISQSGQQQNAEYQSHYDQQQMQQRSDLENEPFRDENSYQRSQNGYEF